jgi:excisionase family DNA binding protein
LLPIGGYRDILGTFRVSALEIDAFSYGMIRFPGRDNPNKYPSMSSNLKIIKICAFCKQEFIARKTTTETCSDACAKRLYKVKQREKAVRRAEAETMVRREPKAFITEGEIKAVQAKEWLTLKEAALLLSVSPLTLRRWTLAGKVRSKKVGRKHLFTRTDLRKIP